MYRILFLVLLNFNVLAQKNWEVTDKLQGVKFATFSMLEPEQCIQLAYERKKNLFAWEVEAGYIFNNYTNGEAKRAIQKIQGFKIRPSVRKYIANKSPGNADGFYISSQLALKYVQKDFDQWIQNTTTLGNMFMKKTAIVQKKMTYGVNLLIGYQLFDSNFLIDFYCGLGLKNRTVDYYDMKNKIEIDTSEVVLFGDFKSGLYPNILLGIKIGYSIKRY
jgi:hypothetical protein